MPISSVYIIPTYCGDPRLSLLADLGQDEYNRTAIAHVFISHFAVGGGAYLWFTEAKAVRENDEEMRMHVKRYSRLFYYLTTVFGAISGVGM